MSLVPSSTNGIDEYRADTFNGAMRGNILTQRYNGETLRFELASDGRSVMSSATLINDFDSLGVVAGPGGVILGGDHSINRLLAAKPVETVTGLRVYDIFPWRAPATGGQSFVIGGEELGSLSENDRHHRRNRRGLDLRERQSHPRNDPGQRESLAGTRRCRRHRQRTVARPGTSVPLPPSVGNRPPRLAAWVGNADQSR